MNDSNNEKLKDLINKTVKDSNSNIANDLSDELICLLTDATFTCPYYQGMIVPFEMDDVPLLPVFTSFDDFKKVYGNAEYQTFKFRDLSGELKFFMDGIIINPQILPFIIDKELVNMVFYRIRDDEKGPVSKGWDVKVRFKDFKPNTWKDIIIPENITFMELDDILKTLWNFNGTHMSAFITDKDRKMIMDGDLKRETMMDGDFDSNFTLINDFFDKYDKIMYWYDFTDDWRFDIEIKKKIDYDKKYVTIKRFKGKYNLIDDCGGPRGYGEILDYLNGDEENSIYLEEFDMDYCQELLERKLYVYSTWYESPL